MSCWYTTVILLCLKMTGLKSSLRWFVSIKTSNQFQFYWSISFLAPEWSLVPIYSYFQLFLFEVLMTVLVSLYTTSGIADQNLTCIPIRQGILGPHWGPHWVQAKTLVGVSRGQSPWKVLDSVNFKKNWISTQNFI